MLYHTLRALLSGSNFSIPTQLGRSCVTKWLFSLQKIGVMWLKSASRKALFCANRYIIAFLFEIVTFRMNRIAQKNAVRFPKHQ